MCKHERCKDIRHVCSEFHGLSSNHDFVEWPNARNASTPAKYVFTSGFYLYSAKHIFSGLLHNVIIY